MRSPLGTPPNSSTSSTFCTTVLQGISPGDWKTQARSGPGPVTGTPEIATSPLVAGSSPARIFITVLLPQPDGPMIDTNSCGSTAKSISLSAWVRDSWRPTIRS